MNEKLILNNTKLFKKHSIPSKKKKTLLIFKKLKVKKLKLNSKGNQA
jgi:hypothetical protein